MGEHQAVNAFFIVLAEGPISPIRDDSFLIYALGGRGYPDSSSKADSLGLRETSAQDRCSRS